MMFILRTVFWLLVVSAFMPAREGQPGIGEQTGRVVGAAMDYCASRPGECAETARSTAQAIRIPAEFLLKAQGVVTAGTPPSSHAAVPQPQPRPAAL